MISLGTRQVWPVGCISKLLELSPDVADIDSDTSSLRKSDTIIEGSHNSELGDLNSD